MGRNRHRFPAPSATAPAEQESAEERLDSDEETEALEEATTDEAGADNTATAPAEQEEVADGQSAHESSGAVSSSEARPGAVRCRVNTSLRYGDARYEAGDVAEFPEHIAKTCPALEPVEG